MSDFEPGVQSPKLKVGDRVRYVPGAEPLGENWSDNVWYRRTQRDSIIVGLPDRGRYQEYRLVTIFEPGEETTWSERDFWFAPGERLARVEPNYQYQVFDTKRSRVVMASVPDEDLDEVREYAAKGVHPGWVLRRRVVGEWEEV